MAMQTNPCEGTDGTTVTTANSDDNGGTAFGLVNINSGTICAYETTGAIHGTSSIRMQTSTAANTVLVDWGDTGATTAVARWYINFTSLPTALLQLGVNFRGNAGVTSLARSEVQTDGTFRVVMGSSTGSFSGSALSTSTTYRLEAVASGFNGSSGTITVTAYVGESTSAFTSATVSSATTSFTCDHVRFGKFALTGNFDALWDSMAADIGGSTAIGRFLASTAGRSFALGDAYSVAAKRAALAAVSAAAATGSAQAVKVASVAGNSPAAGVGAGAAAKAAAVSGTAIAAATGTGNVLHVGALSGIAAAAPLGSGNVLRVATVGGLGIAAGTGTGTVTAARSTAGRSFAAGTGQGRVGLLLPVGEVRTVPAPTVAVTDTADPDVSVRAVPAPTVSVT